MSDTIREDYKLPSLGKLYGKQFDPKVTLRSMTVEDEMKRLSPTTKPYEKMSEIIDSCLVKKLPISVYNLCLNDYIYLLHKLRTVTYGPEYIVQTVCPYCGTTKKVTVNLDEEEVSYYTNELVDMMTIELPVSKHTVKLRLQTPSDLDKISLDAKDMKEKYPEMGYDPTYLLTLKSLIDEIDGGPVNQITILETLKKLPMADTNLIAKTATKLNERLGVSGVIKWHCDECGNDINSGFPYTSEFYGPSID